MATIHLNRQEIHLASQIFQEELEELRTEVRHTDRLEYKEELKQREHLLQGLIIKVEKSRYEEDVKERVH